MVNVVWAVTVEVPVVGEVMVVVHDPVPPEVVQLVGGLGVEVAPLASTVVNVMIVPSGAFTKPAAVAQVGVDVGGEGVAGADPVGPVGGDLDVGVLEDLGRVTAVGRDRVGLDGERRRARDRQGRSWRGRSPCPRWSR